MYCSKCGAQIPEGSTFCSSCGTQISGDRAKGPDSVSQWVKADPVRALITLGSLLAIIGTFLRWISIGFEGVTTSALGVNTTTGPVVLMGGVLSLAVLVVARSGTPGRRSSVMLLLSALMLALIFQAMYYIKDNDASIAAGLYVAMVGALAITAGSILEEWSVRKE